MFLNKKNKQSFVCRFLTIPRGNNFCKKERGFTLIELMVILLIVLSIAVVVFLAIDNIRKRTRDAIIASSLEQLIAIGEQVYHPEIDYKNFWKMREENHKSIVAIRDRITDMGRPFNFHFLEDSLDYEGYDYCAYVRLFMDEDKIFCVDRSGVAGTRDVGKGETKINCQQIDSQYANCDYIK